jgi:hypothetical protein
VQFVRVSIAHSSRRAHSLRSCAQLLLSWAIDNFPHLLHNILLYLEAYFCTIFQFSNLIFPTVFLITERNKNFHIFASDLEPPRTVFIIIIILQYVRYFSRIIHCYQFWYKLILQFVGSLSLHASWKAHLYT